MKIGTAAALLGLAGAATTSLGAQNDAPSFRDIFDSARNGVRFETMVDAAPYDTLKFDINQFDYVAREVTGAPAELSSSFTGSITFSYNESLTRLNSVEGRNGGRFGQFFNAGDGGTLTTFEGILNLNSGMITGGEFNWSNDQTDDVATAVAAAGGVITTVGSGYQLDGLLFDFYFDTADRTFGEVDLSKFYDGVDPQETISNHVEGDFVLLRLSGASSGTADGEWVVTIPAPSALCLLGLTCASTRRRR